MKIFKWYLIWGFLLAGIYLCLFFAFANIKGCPSGIVIPGLICYPLIIIAETINKILGTSVGDNLYSYLLIGGTIFYFLLGVISGMLIYKFKDGKNANRYAFNFIVLGAFLILFDIFINVKRLVNFTEIFISILGILCILIGLAVFINMAIVRYRSR